MPEAATTSVSPISWTGGADGFLTLLDQTRLPADVVYLNCKTVEEVWQAIKQLSVRGAPAIGISAAYGVVLATCEAKSLADAQDKARKACDHLATSRPTAVNLFWALDRMRGIIDAAEEETPPIQLGKRLLAEAKAIHESDHRQCEAIGRHGLELLGDLPTGAGLLTHCNTGALATGGEGTALAIIFAIHAAGKKPKVYVDETRPLLQGARLTAWELLQRGMDGVLICDSMAAPLLRDGKVQTILVGADRIAANGDTANKIGTYGLAVQARHHSVPFYVAAPTTTFDLSIESGADIPIEQRDAEEITCAFGKRTAPENAIVDNPAFDVTPAQLITAIITERGVISPVGTDAVTSHCG